MSQCVSVNVLMLLTLVSFAECQTLYSNAETRETPEILALQKAVKRLDEENKALKDMLPRKRPCPQKWSSFGNSCYLVVTQKKTQEDAALSCIRHGSKLVEIETKEENDFLRTILGRLGGSNLYWTGGTDVLTENEWVWSMTGIPLTHNDDWRVGEPNGYDGGEDCLQFVIDSKKTWNDSKCNIKMKYICEKNAVY